MLPVGCVRYSDPSQQPDREGTIMSNAPVDSGSPTRQRLIDTAIELFKRHSAAGTSFLHDGTPNQAR